MHGRVNDGAPHTALLEAIMTVKIEFIGHNQTDPGSCRGECLYQIWKGSDKNCIRESANSGAPYDKTA